MSLPDRMWAAAEPTYRAILEHPFLRGLTDATLPPESFAFYVVQDAHYLRYYAQALAVVGAKAPDSRATAMFARHAAGAIEVERTLHDTLLAELGIESAVAAATPLAPTALAYVNLLLATAYGASYPEGVAAVLPCYWVYAEVGRELLARGSPDARYQRWIDTYGGAEFAAVVAEARAAAEALGPGLDERTTARCIELFTLTTRYEWMFWDMGYRREAWPVPVPA